MSRLGQLLDAVNVALMGGAGTEFRKLPKSVLVAHLERVEAAEETRLSLADRGFEVDPLLVDRIRRGVLFPPRPWLEDARGRRGADHRMWKTEETR